MAQKFLGVIQVEAFSKTQDGKPGCEVTYPGQPSKWMALEEFQKQFIPMGIVSTKFQLEGRDTPVTFNRENENTITQKMVDDFIHKIKVSTLGEKTTVVQATLANGFEIVESSSCVDVKNYSEEVGKEICLDRIKNKIWELLGFTLQWSRSALNRPATVDPIQSNSIQS